MLDRVKERITSLSPSEQRVANVVLKHPEEVLHAPISQIAKMAGVSQPTIVRFCRSMACTGLSDFKLRLARSAASGTPFVHNEVTPKDATGDIAAKVFDNAISSLMRSRNRLHRDAIERAATLISKARRVEFYGLGNSGITAQDAQHKFFRLGISCVAYNDSHVQGMAATLLETRDVLVAISASGRTIDLINAARVARAGGANVIVITRADSPLAEVADVVIDADTLEDPDVYSSMTTRIIHLVFIDILAVTVAVRGGVKMSAKLAGVKRTLQKRRLPAPS